MILKRNKGFFNQLIQILPLPLGVSADKEHTTAILAKLYSCVLEKIISIAENPGNVLTSLLGQIKETFTEQNHIELFTKTLLDINGKHFDWIHVVGKSSWKKKFEMKSKNEKLESSNEAEIGKFLITCLQF